MMLAMAASWMRRLYYVDLGEKEEAEDTTNYADRYTRSGTDRYARSTSR